ncbi:hypothetical protein PybrP1_003293, partial [[Pythium] brassicae (nom. inval.)]
NIRGGSSLAAIYKGVVVEVRFFTDLLDGQARPLVLELRSFQYRCAWLFIVTLHAVCAVYLTLLGDAYRFIAQPYMLYYAQLAAGDRAQLLKYAGVATTAVGTFHWWQLLCTIWASIRAKKLEFASGSSAMIGAVSAVGYKLRGVFGVESPVFYFVFTAREIIEIVSQTVQAQRSSALLARPWLNHIVVSLVVVNCWSTPILQHVFRRHEGAGRVVCLLLDALLNMGMSMAIPLAVFLPYYRSFSFTTLAFPSQNYYDTVWFSQLVMELQFLFSIPDADIVSKLEEMEVPTTEAGTSISRTVVHLKRMLVRVLVRLFFAAYGVTLLAIHLHASARLQQQVPGCRLATGSWRTVGYPCSVYTHNCYRQGSTSPNESSWEHLDPSALVFLHVAHCPELRVPHRLRSFPNLLAFLLHNVTVAEWKKENSISPATQLKMVILAFTRTNMTRIPDGLLEPLPPRLMTFRIARSNLTDLPSDLHLKWHHLTTVTIEHTSLSKFPKTLLSLGLRELSLHGNQIETCPELSDAHQHFFSLVLTANPLTALPESLGSGTTFSFFSAERTLLPTIPAWMRSSVQDTMYLAGTPFCDAQSGDSAGTPFLACVKLDSRGNGKFPVEIFDSYLQP